MRKLIVIVIVFSCSVTGSNAQTVTPLLVDSGIWIGDIVAFNPDTVLFLSNTEVIKTDDGGLTWDSIPLNTFAQKFNFWNNSVGLIIHGGGSILRSEDGGNSWTSLPNLSSGITDVEVLDSLQAIVCDLDGYILKTYDGGFTWDTITRPIFGINGWVSLLSFDFVSDKEGFVGGVGGMIAHTSDSGETWDVRFTSFLSGQRFTEISFSNNLNGWAVDDFPGALNDHVWFTSDGGNSWQTDFNTFGLTKFRSVDIDSLGNGLLLESNLLLGTKNGGVSWDTLYYSSMGGPNTFWKAKVVNDRLAFIGGRYAIFKVDDLSTHVEQNESENHQLRVYPTLFQSSITVEIPMVSVQGSYKVMVYSAAGKLILTKEFTDSGLKNIDLPYLSKGMYIVSMLQLGTFSSAKIFKASE